MSFENQIKEILKARLEGTATEEELAILREWLDRSPQNRELAELLEESAENLPLLGRIYGYDEQRVWGNIRKAARKRRMRMLAATARKYAAVAAVAALLALSLCAMRRDKKKHAHEGGCGGGCCGCPYAGKCHGK